MTGKEVELDLGPSTLKLTLDWQSKESRNWTLETKKRDTSEFFRMSLGKQHAAELQTSCCSCWTPNKSFRLSLCELIQNSKAASFKPHYLSGESLINKLNVKHWTVWRSPWCLNLSVDSCKWQGCCSSFSLDFYWGGNLQEAEKCLGETDTGRWIGLEIAEEEHFYADPH